MSSPSSRGSPSTTSGISSSESSSPQPAIGRARARTARRPTMVATRVRMRARVYVIDQCRSPPGRPCDAARRAGCIAFGDLAQALEQLLEALAEAPLRAFASLILSRVLRLRPERDLDLAAVRAGLGEEPLGHVRDAVEIAAVPALDQPVWAVGLLDDAVDPAAVAELEPGAGADADRLDPQEVEALHEMVGEGGAGREVARGSRRPPRAERRSRPLRKLGPFRGRFYARAA